MTPDEAWKILDSADLLCDEAQVGDAIARLSADITAKLKADMPKLKGRLIANQALADLAWFRVGGPAQAMFMPDSEDDLSYFLSKLPNDIPVQPIGLGSNLIVRDGGVPGVVVRLGRGFNAVTVEGMRVHAGTAVPAAWAATWAQIASSTASWSGGALPPMPDRSTK